MQPLRLVLSALLVLTAVACGGDDGGAGAPTSPPATTGDRARTTVAPGESAAAAVGECVVLEEDGGDALPFREVKVPCEEPHDFEVVAIVESDAPGDAPYPGLVPDDEGDGGTLGHDLLEACRRGFADFAGRSAQEAGVSVLYRLPSDAEWDAGDRTVRCIATKGLGTAPGGDEERKAGSVRHG